MGFLGRLIGRGREQVFAEWSTTLDSKDIAPFMQLVSRRIPYGFGEQQLKHIKFQLERMKPNSKKRMEFNVQFEGRSCGLKIRLHLVAEDPVDLYVATDKDLCEVFDEERKRFASRLGY